MDTIILKGMAFYAYHGVAEEEHHLGQRFYVDVMLKLDLSTPGRTDNIQDSVNYRDVFHVVKEIMEGKSCCLLEHVAYKINEALFQAYSMVQEVTTTVHKPGAPIPGTLEDVCVSLHKER